MRNLFGRLWAQDRVFLIAFALVLALFQLLLCAIVASVNLEGALDQILMFAPPVMRALIEQSMLGGSSKGVLAFGWNHPITHAILTAIAIALATRAVAGEIENGAIELTLAQPISRERYLSAHLLFGLLAITAVSCAGVLGTVVGEHVFALQLFGWRQLLQLLANVALLQSAFYCITLFFSALGREAGRVGVIAVLLAVISYLINTVATLWDKAAFTHPYSLHSYYDPRHILVNGQLATSSVVVLATCSIVAATAAFVRFRTRDLP